MTKKNHIAVVYPAGRINIQKEDKEKRIAQFEQLGYEVTDIPPYLPSPDQCTSSPILERATLLSFALTSRKFNIIFPERGGVGTTELIPYLENLLPPIIPDKILVGFSDISFLGIYLSTRYPNLIYIHGHNFFSKNLFQNTKLDENILLQLLSGEKPISSFPCSITYPEIYHRSYEFEGTHKIHGVCLPLNLSLAESISACHFLTPPKNNILFLEECNEPIFRIIRKIDSLINSTYLRNTKAIVLGNFTNCTNAQNEQTDRKFLLELFARKTRLPIIDLPMFGHEDFHFPLAMKGEILIEDEGDTSKIIFTNQHNKIHAIKTDFSADLFRHNLDNTVLSTFLNTNDIMSLDHEDHLQTKVHFTGIGGSGMAQVAGFFVESGIKVTGSDGPIYPPMDKIVANLNVTPDLGFHKENITKNGPDFIVLANIISQYNPNKKTNDELAEILRQNRPVLSFPGALRKYFLHSSRNIVISGTHGKTTTSSLVTFLLNKMDYNPSFLIGGSPVNFKSGFAYHSKSLVVLEGDEYDSAYFDKGPKFLHYEPKISLINNIEYDHADIYDNIESIEAEFLRLAKLTFEKNGFLVANLDDPRVLKIVDEMDQKDAQIIGFTKNYKEKRKFPIWTLKEFKTTPGGIEITCFTPQNKFIRFQTKIFGEHNALNCVASFAILHANEILNGKNDFNFIEPSLKSIEDFRGVKRRFELLADENNITVFDDFAHHPTAITTTLEGFREYVNCSGKKGKLILCFDPKNATLRRNIFEKELIQSFSHADVVYLGKVHQDNRLAPHEALKGESVAKSCGGQYFDDNEKLLEHLKSQVKPEDTVVFMSSGAFDGIPHKFADIIKNKS